MPAPFEAITYDAGRSRDGRLIRLVPMSQSVAETLGPACAAIDPWKRYGVSAERLTATFAATSGGAFRYEVRVGDETAGAMILLSPWLIGPYLQFIAVLPAFQGQGVGRALLGWMEERARATRQRNIWLCVSAFNEPALAFYRAQGWQEAANLPELVANEIDELLMRKRLV